MQSNLAGGYVSLSAKRFEVTGTRIDPDKIRVQAEVQLAIP